MISSFSAEHRFLSNFQPCHISYEGSAYPSVEHAFQAAKTHSQYEKLRIKRQATPGQAKRVGNDREQTTLREDWELVKLPIMLALLRLKFAQEPNRSRLLKTAPQRLIEGNSWHDNFWGNCICPRCRPIPGQNHLGLLLMQLREELGAA